MCACANGEGVVPFREHFMQTLNHKYYENVNKNICIFHYLNLFKF